MATTAADIQSLIDAKVALIASIITTIGTVTATPQPSYSIDGQSFSWGAYLDTLVRAQETETNCLNKLYELQNIIQPYQFQSGRRGY